MCGICGIVENQGPPVDSELLRRMNTVLRHRGPDDEGFHLETKAGLGQRRLSIIDLSTGRQPIYNEDGSRCIVFNGEVYNFAQLRRDLEAAGHIFITRTDTEAILHAYEQWGPDCVHRLRGMFAFAIWDARARRLFLARDRLGIKPLYYAESEGRLVFGSEIKAVIEDPLVRREMDLEALSDYFSYGYVPTPKTVFKDVRKLPAGHHLTWQDGRSAIQQYWDLVFEPRSVVSEERVCEELIECLEEAVRIRLISDVPLGAFLSGGIDSSLVVGLMSRITGEPVVTNTIGFSEQAHDELPYARKTAERFGTRHHEYVVTADAAGVARQLAWYFDEPFADDSAIPTYYVSEMTRRKVTVALSGDGGDENFAGYRRYYFDQLENRVRALLPASLRRGVLGPLARLYPKADRLPRFLRAKTLLTNLSADPVEGYFNTMSRFRPPMKRQLLGPEVQRSLGGYDSIEVMRGHLQRCTAVDPLSRTQYVDFKTYLVDDILTKVDRASMAHSLEVRVPVLDHLFVEFVAGLPYDLKRRGRHGKYIFKKAAATILPAETIHRPKKGFDVPMAEWLRGPLRSLVNETLLDGRLEQRGLFNAQYVNWLWTMHLKRINDHAQPLWTLLGFEMWARHFLDSR